MNEDQATQSDLINELVLRHVGSRTTVRCIDVIAYNHTGKILVRAVIGERYFYTEVDDCIAYAEGAKQQLRSKLDEFLNEGRIE